MLASKVYSIPIKQSLAKGLWLLLVLAAPLHAQFSPKGLSALEQEIVALIDQTRPAVVSIVAKRPVSLLMTPDQPPSADANIRWQKNIGSGFVYARGGYILTTASNVLGAQQVEVVNANGKSLSSHIVGIDPETNIAIIQVAEELFPLRPGHSSRLRIGSWVTILGNALGLSPVAFFGLVNGFRPDNDLIQIGAMISPGMTGGPVINSQAEVIGLVAGTLANPALMSMIKRTAWLFNLEGWFKEMAGYPYGMTLAIPFDQIRGIADQLIKYGQVRSGWVGIRLSLRERDVYPAGPSSANEGVRIDSVFTGSPAEKAGLRSGDVILAVAGQPIRNAPMLKRVVSSYEVGTAIRLKIKRQGRLESVEVILETIPYQANFASKMPYPGFENQQQNTAMTVELTLEALEQRLRQLEMAAEAIRSQLIYLRR